MVPSRTPAPGRTIDLTDRRTDTAEADAPRSDLDLARQQLDAIDRWHLARRELAAAASRTAASREARMDLARRMDVIRAEHRAIVERTDAHLRSSVELLQRAAPSRAIVVHRSTWFSDKVCEDLSQRSIVVVARMSNGAEAVGASIAEQPDLLLVEDSLPMMSGEDVVREVRRFAPHTRIAAHVGSDQRIAAMLEAGADTAYTRRVPHAEIAQGLVGLLTQRRSPV